jgi:hypothetical protein
VEAAAAFEIEQSFRDANRTIMEVAAELELSREVPFLCECCDTGCRDLIRMPWAEFEALHEHGNLFVVKPGHEHLEVEQLVVETAAYNVVEK